MQALSLCSALQENAGIKVAEYRRDDVLAREDLVHVDFGAAEEAENSRCGFVVDHGRDDIDETLSTLGLLHRRDLHKVCVCVCGWGGGGTHA